MKKTLPALLIILSLFACKKSDKGDKNPSKPNETLLLDSMIIYEGDQLYSKTKYGYDTDNRLVNVFAETFFDTGSANTTTTIAYDAEGNMTDATNSRSDGIITTYHTSYENKLPKLTYQVSAVFNADTTWTKYAIKDNKVEVSIRYHKSFPIDTTYFTYDAKGNLKTSTYQDQPSVFEVDNGISPFAAIGKKFCTSMPVQFADKNQSKSATFYTKIPLSNGEMLEDTYFNEYTNVYNLQNLPVESNCKSYTTRFPEPSYTKTIFKYRAVK